MNTSLDQREENKTKAKRLPLVVNDWPCTEHVHVCFIWSRESGKRINIVFLALIKRVTLSTFSIAEMYTSIVNEYLCWRNLKNLKRCTFPAKIYVPHHIHNGITMLNESGEWLLNYVQLCNYLGRSHGSHNTPGIVKEYTEKTWTILSMCHSKFTLILNRTLLKTE